MKRITAVLALSAFMSLAASSAFASCIGNWPGSQAEQWQRTQQYQHKAGHLLGEAAVVGTVAWATDSTSKGVWSALAVGAGREIYKATQPGMRCEWSAMVFGLAGIALGAWASERFILYPTDGGGIAVEFRIPLN